MVLPHSANLISCPVCFVVTGRIMDVPRNSGRPLAIEYNSRAADPPDGNRCKAHVRTETEFRAESIAAMRWAGLRS